jgi:hypothetical protein
MTREGILPALAATMCSSLALIIPIHHILSLFLCAAPWEEKMSSDGIGKEPDFYLPVFLFAVFFFVSKVFNYSTISSIPP